MADAIGRQSAMRQFGIAAFALILAFFAVEAVLLRRFAWQAWTHEFKRLLILGRGANGERFWRGPFQPLLAEIRRMAAAVAAEKSPQLDDTAWSAARLQEKMRETLGGEGIVVVANREPYIHQRAPDGAVKVVHPASGLVTALEPVMRACSGTWIAHGSGSADRATVDAHDRVQVPPGDESYALRRIWLSEEEERGYYYGFSNEGLWTLCHIADARPVFGAADWHQYQRVNARFADAVGREVNGPDPIVLVQDYHFALAPQLIRQRLPNATVLSFWHIPWPNAERFGMCPYGKELLAGLLGSSIVGFHTQLHCNNFIESVERYLEARIDREAQAVVFGGRESLVRSYPISVDWPNHAADSAPPPAECRREVFAELGLAPDALLGVGVDRLDYTKGIEERLLAVERLLERWPHLRGRFTFAQLAAPSRTLIERYRKLDERVEALATRINQRFATASYRPIALLRAHHQAPAVFRYLRAADLCYVSSLDDGMNLVAKEFVAARSDERGVLVLSRFTGAARELKEALIVNPYDLEEASGALAAALALPPAEQAHRMTALRGVVSEFNVYRWAGHILSDAARARRRGRVSARLTAVDRDVQEVDP
jgi:trehalose 6-phosphate synthase